MRLIRVFQQDSGPSLGAALSCCAQRRVALTKAKENKVESGKVHGRGKVYQKSDEPIKPVDTVKEAAKLAGVSHDTFRKGNLAEI